MEQQIEEKVLKCRYISKISDFERKNTRKKVYKMYIESQGKIEKVREKSGKSQGIPCQKFGRHPEYFNPKMYEM